MKRGCGRASASKQQAMAATANLTAQAATSRMIDDNKSVIVLQCCCHMFTGGGGLGVLVASVAAVLRGCATGVVGGELRKAAWQRQPTRVVRPQQLVRCRRAPVGVTTTLRWKREW